MTYQELKQLLGNSPIRDRVICNSAKTLLIEAVASLADIAIPNGKFESYQIGYDYKSKYVSVEGHQSDTFVDLQFSMNLDYFAFVKYLDKGEKSFESFPADSEVKDLAQRIVSIMQEQMGEQARTVAKAYSNTVRYGTVEYLENEFNEFASDFLEKTYGMRNAKLACRDENFGLSFSNLAKLGANMNNIHVINNN